MTGTQFESSLLSHVTNVLHRHIEIYKRSKKNSECDPDKMAELLAYFSVTASILSYMDEIKDNDIHIEHEVSKKNENGNDVSSHIAHEFGYIDTSNIGDDAETARDYIVDILDSFFEDDTKAELLDARTLIKDNLQFGSAGSVLAMSMTFQSVFEKTGRAADACNDKLVKGGLTSVLERFYDTASMRLAQFSGVARIDHQKYGGFKPIPLDSRDGLIIYAPTSCRP